MRIAVSRKLLDGRMQRVHCRSIADGVSHDIAGDALIAYPISYAPSDSGRAQEIASNFQARFGLASSGPGARAQDRASHQSD